MAKYRFGAIVKEVKINVNRDNNPYEFYVAGDHMDSEDLIIRRKGRFLTDDVGPAFTRIFHPGQVLYGSRRTYLKKVAIADFDGICANTTFVLETKDNNIFTQELLPFIMLSDRFTEWSVSHSKGSTNPYVLFSDLADFEIELPDINTQRSLAKKLTSAHNVKESYKTLQKCTDEMVKSQFIEMFWGGKYTMKKLRGHIEVLRGVSYKPSDVHEDLSDNTSIVLRSNNIDGGQVNFDDLVYVDSERVSEHQVLNAGDIVMCGSNGSKKLVGKAALLNETPRENTSFGAFCLGIRCKSSIIPEYLATYFQTSLYRDKIEALGSGSNILNIKPDHIYDLEIPIPSLGEQETFVSIVKQADKSKFELKKSIEAIDKVIKSLINNI